MAAIDTEFADSFAEMIVDLGETVTLDITDVSAIVNSQPQFDELVTGGVYGHKTLSITLLKTAITFVPAPQMYVVARGDNYRIADDGVTVGRDTYKITVVARDVPKR